MAEKTGFILYYEMLENLKSLGNDTAIEVLSALSNYDQGLETGELSLQAQFAFNVYIPIIKKSKRRWEASVNNGRQNKANNNLNEPRDNLDEANNELGQCVTVNDNVNENVNANDNDNVQLQKTSSSNFLNTIQEEAEKVGFSLDTVLAKKIAESGINPAWITGAYNFCEYAKEMIDGNIKYNDKPHEEKRLLFVNSFTWESCHADFPVWQAGRRRKAEAAENKRRIEMARENKPEKCKCGGNLKSSMDYLVCDSCNGLYIFDEEKQEYIFNENITESLKDLFTDLLRSNRGNGEI